MSASPAVTLPSASTSAWPATHGLFRNKNRRIKLGQIGSASEASAASKADGFEGVRRKDFWRSWTSSSGVSSWPQIHNGHGKALLSTTRVLTADCTLEVMRLNHTAVRLQTFRVRGSHHTEDCQGGKRKSYCLEALGLCRPLSSSRKVQEARAEALTFNMNRFKSLAESFLEPGSVPSDAHGMRP